MKLVKGMLLEFEKKPRVVEFNRDNYKELYPLLDCDTFEHAIRRIGNKKYDLWFDEEYLLKQNKLHQITGVCANYEEMIRGNILITLSADCEIETLEEEDIKNILDNIVYSLLDEYKTYILLYRV